MSHEISSSEVGFRLSRDVKPFCYELQMIPDLENETFEGNVTISIKNTGTPKSVVLHQKDLNISNVSINSTSSLEAIKIKESYSNNEDETFTIVLNEELIQATYNIFLSFSGSLSDKIVGFYSSRYKDEENRTRVIATSKFEPTYARRAFPCFDEPGFKAEFRIQLVYRNDYNYNTLSNMNIKEILVDMPEQGLTTVKFEHTPPMPTYLVCFIISDFVAVSKVANRLDGKELHVSVYTTRAQKKKGLFALDIGVKIIEYYINLFKIDYPLPKLDMAAIPDFVSGAMENWGLVTFREARLLFDDKSASTTNKEGIVKVIGHEFAHMWFGNLVTMAWWDDLWLNEGFATYMQYKSSDAILPECKFLDHFLIEVLHPALKADAILSSRPIVQEVSNPDQITAIFDVISYQKGASILRMLEHFISSEIFYIGIKNYLEKFTNGNATTTDLVQILQQAYDNYNGIKTTDKINIEEIMKTWTKQMGYPVVSVSKQKLTYTLTQKRFLYNPSSNPSDISKSSYKWTIPITYITNKNSSPTIVWFDKDASNLSIKLDEPVDWIKFNVNQVGYYRVNYNQSEWENLLNILLTNPEYFSVQDRTHLLEDAFSLANAGELDYIIPLNMTLYLHKEKHFSPWVVAANKLKAIDKLLFSTKISTEFRTYVRDLVDSTYHDVTWNINEMEDHEKLNLRSSILELTCSIGHGECLEDVGIIFKNWINDEKNNYLHPDIRGYVYYYGMNHINREDNWNIMFERFTKETDAAEKMKLMHGLAGIRLTEVLKKYINLAMDENYVRTQDALNCLSSISMNPVGCYLIWDWVRENWLLLVKRYTLNDRYLGKLLPLITMSFSTKDKLNEMTDFFKKYPEAGAGSSYRAQALETVAANIKWVEKNSEKISEWLNQERNVFIKKYV
ncbi:PREDICTED: glutamyl aminopeptidase-like [Ceratosolen solmsi marchali]|uniref:Aminopeptidase n=1 Tax=Ceratosolen solmsi marchali TaxID=326594 RepID=A0AAJ7DY65_9HYME|nr:PREDICTED: glutamyl aminopeptidase-like [Ceratosolen solmsi marchali]